MTYHRYKFGAICSAIFRALFGQNAKKGIWSLIIVLSGEQTEKRELFIIRLRTAKKLQKLYPKLLSIE